jgi:hypothetical protein
MSNPSDENKSQVTVSFNVQYLKKGSHIVFLPVPEAELRLIGLVAAHWGTFEVQLNSLIASILASIGQVIDGWERLGFKKRKEMLADLIKEQLADLPETERRYRKLLGDAADLYWRRNTVAHGQYRVTFPPAGSEPPSFWAESFYKNRPVRVDINVPTLEKLWHDIAHLTGELQQIVKSHGGTVSGWPQAWPDEQILRVYTETIHPWNPNPDMRPPQPVKPAEEGCNASGPRAPPPQRGNQRDGESS